MAADEDTFALGVSTNPLAVRHSPAFEFTAPLKAALDNLDELTAWVIAQAKANPNEIGAASVEYLHVFGYTAYAYMWARMAAVATRALRM